MTHQILVKQLQQKLPWFPRYTSIIAVQVQFTCATGKLNYQIHGSRLRMIILFLHKLAKLYLPSNLCSLREEQTLNDTLFFFFFFYQKKIN